MRPGARQIETERLILRPPCEADLTRIVALANNRAVAEKLARMPHPYGEADARDWLDWLDRLPQGSASFAIGLKAEAGAFIGACGYDTFLHGLPDLGYWLGEPYWGHRYASEAAAALVDHAFEVSGLEFITSGCRLDNPASGRVLEKLGFRPDGRRSMFSLGAGREVDIESFRLTREQWVALGQTRHAC
jgi:RimJ/RimL family protein N-acetyltransferase